MTQIRKTVVPGESVLEHVERTAVQEDAIPDLDYIAAEFEVSAGAVKALWLASENFNTNHSYGAWKGRKDRGADNYGAFNYLRRRYKLDDATTWKIIAELEAGNERALIDTLGFEKLAETQLTEWGQEELVKLGVLPASGAG